VCPGFVETRWLQQGFGEQGYANAKSRYEQSVPLQKVIMPEDIARAVVWLLEGADLVTGETILVDSGAHLGGAPLKAR
jgi:3-oxoacyl-[acyl-carrier protein] reductase